MIVQSREHLNTARVREHIYLVLFSIVMQKVLSLLRVAAKWLSKKFLEKLQLSPLSVGPYTFHCQWFCRIFYFKVLGVFHLHLLVPIMKKKINILCKSRYILNHFLDENQFQMHLSGLLQCPFIHRGSKLATHNCIPKQPSSVAMETARMLGIWIVIKKDKPLPCVLPASSFLILISHQAWNVQPALGSELDF